MPRRSEMQSVYKEKQEDVKGKPLKVSFKAIFNVHFANLESKKYFSIQRLIMSCCMNNRLAWMGSVVFGFLAS